MLARIARLAVMPLAILLAVSVLAQAFLAGVAAAIDADYWDYHKNWIALFQWLSILLAAAAWVSGHERITRWLSLIPILLIAAQYSSIHLALRYALPWLAGVHALNALLLFGTLVLLVERSWR